jgi:uncharacterized protein
VTEHESPGSTVQHPVHAGRTSALDPWPQHVQWRAVSPRMITMELTKAAVWAVALIAAGTIGWLASGDLWPAVVAGILLALSISRDVVAVRAARSYGYAERDRDLLVRHGRMIRRLSIVPYARMQFVDVTAGPLERLFRLATVRLHTAAAASDATVPGLEPAEATRLRDRLAALGEDRGEGL